MHISIHADYDAMSQAAAEDFLKEVAAFEQPLVCLPSGKSPVGFLKYIVAHFVREGKRPDWHFIGLDEWVGIGGDEVGSCLEFFQRHLFQPLGIPEAQVHFFNGKAADLAAECAKAEALLNTHHGIDICVLGIGTNGHLGLNEPGSDPSLRTQLSQLADSTIEAAKDYFDKPSPVTQGITLGLASLLSSRKMYLLASGIGKSPVIQQVVEGPVARELPGSFLQGHADCRIFLDTDAAAGLSA